MHSGLRWRLRRLLVASVSMVAIASPVGLLASAPAAAQTGTTIHAYSECGGASVGAGGALINALQAAQDHNASGECPRLGRGLNGPYTIVLNPVDNPYVLTAVNNYSDGPDGLPAIIDAVTVESAVYGRLAVVERKSSQPFRFFDVAAPLSASCASSTYAGSNPIQCPQYQTPADVSAATTTIVPGLGGSLTLKGIELTGGLAQGGSGADDGGGGAGMGGAIFAHGGTVTLLDSLLQGNRAQGGAGGGQTGDGQGGGGGLGGSGGAGGPLFSMVTSGGGGGMQGNGASSTGSDNGAGGGPNGGSAGAPGGYGGGGGGSPLGANGGFGGGGGGGQYDEGGSGGFGGGAGAGASGFAGFGGGTGFANGGGGGGDGMGGAVFTLGGNLTVTGSTLSANTASGGGGGPAANGASAGLPGQGDGGGIYVDAIVPGEYDGGSVLTVSGATLQGNRANTSGGAIDLYGGSTTVSNTTFSGNTAGSGRGSAIAIAAGSLSVSGSAFSGNAGGAAIGDYSLPSGFAQRVTIFVANSAFSGNTDAALRTETTTGVFDSNGALFTIVPDVSVTNAAFSQNTDGAIENSGAAMTVSGSSFSDNSGLCASGGNPGGAITNAGTLTVADTSFTGNHTCGAGGAIANSASLTISGASFTSNRASSGGGAIANSGGTGTLRVFTSTFSGNSAADGGAIDTTATAAVSGATFSDNQASSDGGAIDNGGTLTLANATFSNNTAILHGGGIDNGATLSAANVTLSGNGAGTGGGNLYGGGALANTLLAAPIQGGNCAGGTVTGSPNLEYPDTTCGSTTAGWLNGNPELGPLAANGGPTQTMALGSGSAAREAGDPTACATAPVGGFDQRGFPRPALVCDIGAYEGTSPGQIALYGMAPRPIAPPGSLPSGQPVSVTVSVATAAGAPAAFAPVFLSFSGTGTASAGGVPVLATPQVFSADQNGHVAVTYTPAAVAPPAGSDVLTASGPNGSRITTVTDAYTYAAGTPVAAPEVAGVTPAYGPPAGGTTVTIAGGGFTGATAVRFGGVAATSFTLLSDRAITAVSPGGPAGQTVDVTVTTPEGPSPTSGADQFTYVGSPVVTAVTPAAGPAAGATAVTISGNSFLGATAVYFGGVPAAAFLVASDPAIDAVSLGGTAGTRVQVTVASPNGQSATSGADRFSYQSGLSAVTPDSGPAGTPVTLSGGGFGTVAGAVYWSQGTTTLRQAPPAAAWSAGSIATSVPPGLSPGTVAVAVYNSTTGVDSNTQPFTVTASPPVLTAINPASGPVGTPVTLAGNDFGTVAGAVYWRQGTVTLRQSPPQAGWLTDQVMTTVPPGLAAGTVSVAVYSASGLTSNALALTVTAPVSARGGSGLAIPVANTVGAAGGSLVTADGACLVTIAPGAIPEGDTVTLTESTAPPTGIPSGLVVASPVCTLGGSVPKLSVPITVAYAAPALRGRSPQRLSLYAQAGGGSAWTFAPTAVNPGQGTVSARAAVGESLVVLGNLRVFPDVPAGYWAAGPIDDLLAADVIEGFPDGTFRPDTSLTRAAFTKMLVLTLGLPVGSGQTPFSDVSANAWYAPYVAAAAGAGIVRGTSATTFGPGQAMTREQLAVVVARAMKLARTATLHFTDSTRIAAWALRGVEQAVAGGYLDGFPNGSFQPESPATRAQAAKVLAMLLREVGT